MKFIQKPLAAAMGAAFLTSVSAVSIAQANENPFTATQLSSGYMQVAMEGKCGGDKKMKEGSCGADKMKTKCVDGKKMKEGKCGEGKCGGDKMKKCADDKKMKEGKCGGDKKMDKSMEGKCGGNK